MHDRLGDRVGYFPRNQEELEEMADARVLMSSYFAEMLIFFGWNQGKIVVSRLDSHNFLHGVQRD